MNLFFALQEFVKPIIGLVLFLSLTMAQFSTPLLAQSTGLGVTISGMERVWETPRFRSKEILDEIKACQEAGFNAIRLPLAVNYFMEHPSDFLANLNRIIRYTEKRDIPLVLVYFDHELDEGNVHDNMQKLTKNWKIILESIGSGSEHLYLELANEPKLNPDTWENAWITSVKELREVNSSIPLVIGATNFNSLYELSRTRPPALPNLIFTFHFYEPFVFTHQGAEWTGDQNATLGIPYPYQEGMMPELNQKAKSTAGEVNYRDYFQTGNQVAIEDKVGQIVSWANENQVAIWCTEFGATANADPTSRKNYLKEVSETLKKYDIPAFIWEWEGNFGVKGFYPLEK